MNANVVCASCSAALRDDAKFCHECGTRTAAPVDTAKYKQVTVLFADVVRSMAIAATLDVERLREIMTELVERAAAVIHRYGGGSIEYTGDGVMALFGAPVALEDHAFRACLAALAIQEEADRLASEVQSRDGVALQLRVGLNSGRVIAGALGGSGSLGYAAVGEPVGYAQRMESVAPPGGVMLSESTARLVEDSVLLGEPEWVHIKGSDEPVYTCRLIAIGPRHGQLTRTDVGLVGRRWEMATIGALADRTMGGRGGVVNVVGPAGIGKSRVAREAETVAVARGFDVHWTFCESHAHDVPFYAVTRLLRESSGVADLEGDAARDAVREFAPDADPQDLLLLDELLGIADPNVPLPQIDPDARRRRLTALLNSVSLARSIPALFIIEDAHWIDAVSESMLADLLPVVPHAPLMVLITSRPEYDGPLKRIHNAQTIALAPLDDSDTAILLAELLGSDLSVGDLSAVIAERAAGNPFFAEEMVREFGQRGVLTGERGRYVCRADVAELTVPPTVQAAIEARIDRLSGGARQTLSAASVIGVRFEADLLTALGIDPAYDELLAAELIDPVRFTTNVEFAFRHPLIRAVAYESQLKSDRAHWHGRLATAIEKRAPGSVEENAAMIAEHVEAAGALHAAYGWHMRAGAWSINHNLDAARLSWERARQIADRLPEGADQLPMRIAPRTMLCTTDWNAPENQKTRGRFAELRELCTVAGDKVSLAIGMTGMLTELAYTGRIREASRMASEQMALLESIGDPAFTMPLAFLAFAAWFEAGELNEISRWSQTVVDLSGGDPSKGAGFGVASPLSMALTWRAAARWSQGRAGWRQDLHDAVQMAQNTRGPAHQSASQLAAAVTWTYAFAIHNGVLLADDYAVHAIEEARQVAATSGNDVALSLTEFGLGIVLLSRAAAAERHRGLELMMKARDTWLRRQIAVQDVPIVDLWAAREKVRGGDLDAVVPEMRRIVNDLYLEERLGYGVWATGVLVESLLERGTDADRAEAQRLIDRLATLRADQESAIREITLLRLRALLAKARGDTVAYRDLANRYRGMAESLNYDGHTAWAKAMTDAST